MGWSEFVDLTAALAAASPSRRAADRRRLYHGALSMTGLAGTLANDLVILRAAHPHAAGHGRDHGFIFGWG